MIKQDYYFKCSSINVYAVKVHLSIYLSIYLSILIIQVYIIRAFSIFTYI